MREQTSTPPRFKGAPFNLRTIRWHKTRRGWEWQYWNFRVDRWTRFTKERLSADMARIQIAQHVYGCDPAAIAIEDFHLVEA
jgi:hypothetical protein